MPVAARRTLRTNWFDVYVVTLFEEKQPGHGSSMPCPSRKNHSGSCNSTRCPSSPSNQANQRRFQPRKREEALDRSSCRYFRGAQDSSLRTRRSSCRSAWKTPGGLGVNWTLLELRRGVGPLWRGLGSQISNYGFEGLERLCGSCFLSGPMGEPPGMGKDSGFPS